MAASVIGEYRLIRQLAKGGMGIVYLAEHVHDRREVAVKVLHAKLADDSAMVARFFAEAVASARISHPGVVKVFDFGWFGGDAYLVMEYLRGETLGNRLQRETRLSIRSALDIGVQLGLALAATHAAGIVHRDLKPNNVYLVPDPHLAGNDVVKVLDFGVAKLVAGTTAHITQTGDLLGTPPYMAPEQTLDAGQVDHRSDIYSLGCLLYHLLTGNPPFTGSLLEVLVAHRKVPPPPPRFIVPAISPRLEQLLLRMMAKSRGQRPNSMMEIVHDLTCIEHDPQDDPGSLATAS